MSQTRDDRTLTEKLTDLLTEIERKERAGARINFALLRNLLGQRRVMLLPSVLNHHQVTLPRAPDEPERVRTTVVLEIALIDARTEEQVTSRWIGQALAAPEVSYERAITHALDDFLQKTFLMLAANDDDERPAPADPTAPPAAVEVPPALTEQAHAGRSRVRRRPRGSSSGSPSARAHDQLDLLAHPPQPQANEDQEREQAPAPQDGASPWPALGEPAEPPASDGQEGGARGAREEEGEAEGGDGRAPLPELTPAWKAANALWRALVSAVAPPEVMDAFEAALEREHGVDSWRRVTPEQIRASCHTLRRRSAHPSDVRKISAREEYILSRLDTIPEGSSITRIEHELRRLVLEVEDEATWRAFLSLYLEKVGASTLSEAPARGVVALCRKLRRLKGQERCDFICGALEQRGAA